MISLLPLFILGTCIDGIQNGKEDAVDCGGACPACGKLVYFYSS